MRVLVVGGGGREHALSAAILRSPTLGKLYVAPGNAGIAQVAECVPISADDTEALAAFARENSIDLTVVGPEAPLVAGIVDRFQRDGLRIFGPSKKAARLEGSKVFTKDLCRKSGVPTGGYRVFHDPVRAIRHVDAIEIFPVVLKADGLAAGKGVIVAKNRDEAAAAVRELMVGGSFGDAGKTLVIEEFLQGTEASLLALVDGRSFTLLEPARDHKAAHDGDSGPNTGGMGAVSPVRRVDAAVRDQVEREILIPVIHAMGRLGSPFKGFLYAGLMLTQNGPKVLEFNVRLGDPETQVILPRLKSDLVRLLALAADGKMEEAGPLDWDPRPACGVVLSSGGYPGKYDVGFPILGLDQAAACSDTEVYHAGTTQSGGEVLTAGGRVLCVTSLGKDLDAARKRAYEAVTKIRFQGAYYRGDIGRAEAEGR